MDETAYAVTEDRVLGGRVLLRQPAKGYRAGLDAALLAAACDAKPGEQVIDVGCGVGAVSMLAAARRSQASFVGMERDAAALGLARENIAATALADRIEAVAADVAHRPPSAWAGHAFRRRALQPAFLRRRDADPRTAATAKRGAVHRRSRSCRVAGLSSSPVTRDGGAITLIHRADRLADILSGLGVRAGSFQVRPIHPFADEPAGRVLVRSVRGAARRCGCCRRWCCTFVASRGMAPRPKRSCAARRASHGSDHPCGPDARRQHRRAQSGDGRPEALARRPRLRGAAHAAAVGQPRLRQRAHRRGARSAARARGDRRTRLFDRLHRAHGG